MKKVVTQNKAKDNKSQKLVRLFIVESFYFITALLFLGLLVELIFPGLFQLYFNSAFLASLWLINAFLLILYDRK
jgi:hypothetical protein